MAIASAFMFYAEHFKLYSSFCASHSKAQKALHPSKLPFQMIISQIWTAILKKIGKIQSVQKWIVHSPGAFIWPTFFPITDEGNQALQEFLMSCNTKRQQSTSLESYLIKPIQRILKYPLLLGQLKSLCSPQEQQGAVEPSSADRQVRACLGVEKLANEARFT